MRELAWQDTFAGALCFWGSFGYFEDDGNEQFLRAVYRALKPGGRFVLETLIAETLLPLFQERGWQQIGETLLLERRWYDYVQSRVGTEWTLIHEGKSETQTTSIRIYTYRERCKLFGRVGFVLGDAYDTRSRQPFTFGARRLTVGAQKPAQENME
ncbi:MAG: class I SAM-dependent methyltransferase [Deltaproteobacteria bacterium]|nr:class I SAM-dependent methyltransferase [Deltaproteobacteria bacterium]